MGMFDWVTDVPTMDCYKCGELLGGWQSKDAACTLANVPFFEVKNFYTSCDRCDAWHEWTRTGDAYPHVNYTLKYIPRN